MSVRDPPYRSIVRGWWLPGAVGGGCSVRTARPPGGDQGLRSVVHEECGAKRRGIRLGVLPELRPGCPGAGGGTTVVRLRHLVVGRTRGGGAHHPGGKRTLAAHRGRSVRHRTAQRRLSPHHASEMGKAIVGQERVLEETAHRHLRPRPLPAGRRARPGQDADDPHAGRRR